jgi:hypothetical protein
MNNMVNNCYLIINKKFIIILLWLINLSSISASVLMYIFLAYYAYSKVGSLLLSEFVLFSPMVIPVVFVLQIGKITTLISPKNILLWSNLLGIILCFLIFIFINFHPIITIAGAAVIGMLDAIQRVTRIVVIKQYFNAEEVKFTVPLTLTAQFIAGGFAGALLAFFPGKITLEIAVIAAVILFAIAVLGSIFLPKKNTQSLDTMDKYNVYIRFFRLIKENRKLKISLFNFVLLGAFFQGFYNVSRVVLPAHHLGLSQQYVGILQVVASSAALSGAIFFYVFSKRGMQFSLKWLYFGSAIAMVAACAVSSPFESFFLYFIYFFIFELAFFRLQADIMSASPADQMPLIATMQYALVYTGMMLAIFIGAFLVNSYGLFVTAVLFVLIFLLIKGIYFFAIERCHLCKNCTSNKLCLKHQGAS